MKRMIMTAMMIMATMSFTASVSAQEVVDKKAKKECCDKKQSDKADKACCQKKADSGCCDKKQAENTDNACQQQEPAKAKDCTKCGQCKPDCAEKGCTACPNNHQCDKGCKK